MLWVIIEFVVFLSAAVLALFIIQEDPDDLKNYWLFITVVLLGVGIARRAISHNREKVQFKYATKLAEFIDSGNALRLKIDEDPLPIEEHNDWVAEIETYLHKSRKPHCVTRLSDFSGMTCYGDGSGIPSFETASMAESVDFMSSLEMQMCKNTHNKALKYVPALCASTGHKNAAYFYAA